MLALAFLVDNISSQMLQMQALPSYATKRHWEVGLELNADKWSFDRLL